MLLASNPLIQVTPGLMIWTIVCFLIALYVLKRYAFGPIQHTIDQRRERIRQSLDAADHAREEAQKLLEEHRKLIASAQTDAEQIRLEVVDLSLLAATKVTRKSLDDADQKRLIEEAVGELDFSVLEGNE